VAKNLKNVFKQGVF